MGRELDLIHAVRTQDFPFVQRLLQKPGKSAKRLKGSTRRLNVNYQDGDGMSALHQAALMGNTDIMELLLDSGASVAIKDNKGMIALHYASWQGKSEPVHILLQWKSPVNEQSHNLETSLHLACQHGHFDVVNLLLLHHASPCIPNKEFKTPLDLACEFGRYRVVDLLLRSNLCSPLLQDGPSDLVDNKRTTCLHLAARNGHVDIIRLLLQAGVNVNRSTLQGTSLHEAALFGKTDVVRLLLDCGVDVNKVNSYDQTALDIVNKFTTTRAAKDIKQLLKEASFAVQARAIKDFCNLYEPQTLAFKEGDIIKVIEQKQNGYWRGSLVKEGRMAKTGLFPADHVVLIDNNALGISLACHKYHPSTSMPSLVHVPPDLLTRTNSGSFLTNGYDRNSFGSSGTDDSFPPPPSPLLMPRSPARKEFQQEITRYPPPPPPSYQSVIGNSQQYLTGKVIVNHVGESYLNGPESPVYPTSWDMRSSSPAKDSSPVGSNRNSAASSDSGRGLSTNYLDPKVHHNYVNVQINNGHHRLSGTSYESGVSSRQSYHSTSSSSVGSLDRLEESGYSSQINVAELFQLGVPDHEVLRAWLSDLHYEEYYPNFIQAGYDMPTITHMTPQDLTAIGISKPGHRKKIKAELGRLNIHDGIPDFKPNDILEWLRLLNLEQYYSTLVNQGYTDIESITDIMWEDLEEIGIQRLGHQKKIMLAIDRLKRIMSGSKRLSAMDGGRRGSTELLEPPIANSSRWSGGELASPPPPAPPMYSHDLLVKPRRSSSGDSLSTNSSGDSRTHQLSEGDSQANGTQQQPDVVAIQVKRSMSQSAPNSFADGREAGNQPKMCQSFHAPDRNRQGTPDRENTPTGDDMDGGLRSSAGMVPPIAPKVMIKPKPVAKIIAKTKRSSREGSPDIIDIEKHEAEKNNDGYKSPIKNLEGFHYPCASNGKNHKVSQPEHIYDQPRLNSPKAAVSYNFPKSSMPQGAYSQSPTGPIYVSTQYQQSGHQQGSPRNSQVGQQGSPGGRTKKNPPPPPPKRTHSIKAVENHTKNGTSKPVVTSDSSSAPPPIAQKPQTSIASAQQQAFVNCVQSLSERFGKKSEEHGASDCQSSDGEDLPPPPPPVAMDIITPKVHNYGLLGKSDKTSSGEYMLQQRLKREGSAAAAVAAGNTGQNGVGVESAFGVKLRKAQSQAQSHSSESVTVSQTVNANSQVQQSHSGNVNNSDTTVQQSNAVKQNNAVQQNSVIKQNSEVQQNSKPAENSGNAENSGKSEIQRKDSTGSLDGNTSSSSVDSNTLPFANENVGTIKQRTPTTKPSIVQVMDDSEESHTNSVFVDNSDTIKRTAPKPMYNTSVTASYSQPKPTPKPQTRTQATKQEVQRPPVPQKPQVPQGTTTAQGASGQVQKGKKKSGDVLSEIDTMLQGLTEELDAMLDFEVQE